MMVEIVDVTEILAQNKMTEENYKISPLSKEISHHLFKVYLIFPLIPLLYSQNTGGFYKCNRFDAIKTDGSTSAAQKAKAELERYLFYYQRFHGHDSALKFAAGQREAAERRMVERQEAQRSTWIDVQFLKHAAEQVIDCRRVLKYSYALGYFLENDSLEKQLFEHHQELLEKNTEKLHEYTEQSLDVIDRTQVCMHTPKDCLLLRFFY